jgi:mannose-1-phosphate guanylyltransferase
VPLPRHALLLTAGLGTRLQPLTAVRAKPAMPVAGVPMIRRIVAWLAASGVTDLVLNLHHLPDTLTAVVGDGTDLAARVRYSWEPVLLGSAGGPRRALPLIGAEPFLIINGDTLTDVDLGAMARAHEASNAIVTLALVPNREPDRYGGVSLDDDGRVIAFPRRGPSAAGSCHFIGVQIVSGDAFRALPDDRPASSIGGVYDALIAARPGAVHGYVSDAAFWDVGTTADYWRTSQAFAFVESGGETKPGRGTRIDPSAEVTQSILWDDVDVGAGCRLDACIVTDGVRIPPCARYARHILVRGDDGKVTAYPHG